MDFEKEYERYTNMEISLMRGFAEAIEKYGLSPKSLKILMFIHTYTRKEKDGIFELQKFFDFIGIDIGKMKQMKKKLVYSKIGKMVKRLSENGLVEILPKEESAKRTGDSRKKLIKLTDKGVEMINGIIAIAKSSWEERNGKQ